MSDEDFLNEIDDQDNPDLETDEDLFGEPEEDDDLNDDWEDEEI